MKGKGKAANVRSLTKAINKALSEFNGKVDFPSRPDKARRELIWNVYAGGRLLVKIACVTDPSAVNHLWSYKVVRLMIPSGRKNSRLVRNICDSIVAVFKENGLVPLEMTKIIFRRRGKITEILETSDRYIYGSTTPKNTFKRLPYFSQK